MTRRKASYIQGTTAAKYQLPAEDARLNDAAGWTPSASGLLVRGGVVPGPGTPGVVTAATGGVNIAAGTAVVQGTTTAVQGAYRCTWDASEFRAVTAASGTTFRRFLLVVQLYDQLNGGAKDDWDLEVVYGAAASTLAAAPVPATPANSLVLKSGSVDTAGVVSVSGVLPFTVPRGGILPTDDTETTAGAYVGQYKDTPGAGLLRWNGPGTGWTRPWWSPWGQLAPGAPSNSNNIGTGDANIASHTIGTLPARRRLRKKFVNSFYTGGGYTTLRLRIEVYVNGNSVGGLGTAYDYRIGGTAGDVVHVLVDDEYVTSVAGSHNLVVWASQPNGAGSGALYAVGQGDLHAEDVGASGVPV